VGPFFLTFISLFKYDALVTTVCSVRIRIWTLWNWQKFGTFLTLFLNLNLKRIFASTLGCFAYWNFYFTYVIRFLKRYFFSSKIPINLSLDLKKGRPSRRGAFSPQKENIQHFKTWNFLTFTIFVGHFCSPESTDLIASGTNPIRIRNTCLSTHLFLRSGWRNVAVRRVSGKRRRRPWPASAGLRRYNAIWRSLR
jgi:hypothetical protein